MAGASRQVIAGDSLLVCPKTWRRRLAVQRAGVADREDERMSSSAQVEIAGGKGGRAGSGRCPPPRRLAARGRRGGGTAPPRCRAPAAACAGGRCPAPSSAPTADRRPALTGPRVHSWARGVAPSTFRRHGRVRRSARGFRESAELWSVSRPRLMPCARVQMRTICAARARRRLGARQALDLSV